ncbi:Ig-like domain-containing protein [Tenacibaculum agarivorans]|uniref:Ig-like domain-containing protein n=1 Tax=Tenacibaculum agarivorans TaxID=1908389 RepID=UPI00094BC369|nr:RICIN domain-containing protein [Tenacibaculum agarivorans]
MKQIFFFSLFIWSTLLAVAQNTLKAEANIITGDGSGLQNWGDGVTLQAFKINGDPGKVAFESRFTDDGFGVAGGRWEQIDYYQDYQGERVDASEKLIINFPTPVHSVILQVGQMDPNEGPSGSDESGKWTAYNSHNQQIGTGIMLDQFSIEGLLPGSKGSYRFALETGNENISRIEIEATQWGYPVGRPPRYRPTYANVSINDSGNTENNSEFNLMEMTYTKINDNATVFANNDTLGPIREDIGLSSFSYDTFLANDMGNNIDIVSFDFSRFPGTIEDDRSNRKIIFRTAVNFNGKIDIPYTIRSGLETSSALITLTITDVIDELNLGIDGPYTTDINTPISIAISDLLANDTASNFGGPVTIKLTDVGNAVNGTVEIVNDKVVFTPSSGFVGNTASFTYDVDVLNQLVFGQDKRVNEGTSSAIIINVKGDVIAPPSINQQAILVAKSNENKTLQVNATANRTSVTLGDYLDQRQIWTISDRGNGFHKIVNNFADRALEAWTRNPSNGDDATIYASNNRDWQQWEIIDVGNGYFKIKGKFNPRFLTSTSNGNAIVADENNQDNQLWKLLDPKTFVEKTEKFANNDILGPIREDIGLTSFSYDAFLANDIGTNIDIISFDFSKFPGTIEDDRSNRKIIFRTAVNFNGKIDIPYTISNGLETSSALITLTIIDVIDELNLGIDGPYTTDVNTPISIAISDLLANDTASNFGGPVTIALTDVGNAINGTVKIVNDKVVFTPSSGFVGNTASFTYDVDVLNQFVFGPDKRVNEGTSSAIIINIEGDVIAPPSINQQAILVAKSNENKTLQVNTTANRTSVTLGGCLHQGQVWTISDRGNGFHKILNNFADRALEAWTKRPSNGDDATIYASNNKDWQQWEIIDYGNGYFKIKGKFNPRFLTSTPNGNAIVLDENNQDNQLWKLLDPKTFECTTANNRTIAVPNSDFAFNSELLEIYPTLVSDELFVSYKLSNDIEVNRIDVLNQSGKLIKKVVGRIQDSSSIFVDDLNTGLYFVKIYSNKGNFTYRILKK